MSEWKWKILNFFQVLFFFGWCVLWIPFTFVAVLFAWGRHFSLLLATHMWAPSLLWVTGSPVEITGQENFDHTKPHVFVMNHQSTLDIIAAFQALRVPLRFLIKEELRWAPFLGQYVWAMGMIFINRRNPEKSRASIQRAGESIRKGANIIAYPEGTRCQDGRIRDFKKGAFIAAIESGVPVVPLAVEGTRIVMPKNSFRLRKHPIRIAIGTPIPTTDLTFEDRDKLIAEAREQMIQLHLSVGGVGAAENNPAPSLGETEPQPQGV